MPSIGDIKVRIGADINPLIRNLNRAERRLTRAGERLSRLGNDLTLSVSAPLALLGGRAITTTANFDALEKSLTAIMGDANLAAEEFKKLEAAAKLPGLGFEQALRGSVRLQAVGLDADTARAALINFGNAIALSGGSAADLDGVTTALGQIASKGKITAEEINQLNERVFQIRPAMKAAFGTSDTEELQNMGISAEEFIAKVTNELAKLPQVESSLKNSLENAGIAMSKFFADIGKDLNETFQIQDKVEKFSTVIDRLGKAFTNLSPETKKTIAQLGLFAIAIGPAVKLLGLYKLGLAATVGVTSKLAGGITFLTRGAVRLTTLLGLLTKGGFAAGRAIVMLKGSVAALGVAFRANPVGFIVTGLQIAAVAFGYAYTQSETFRKGLNGMASVAREAGQIIVDVVNWVGDTFGGFVRFVWDMFKSIGRGIMEFGKMIANAFTGIVTVVSEIINTIKNKIAEFLAPFAEIIETVGNYLGKIFDYTPLGMAQNVGKRLAEAFGKGYEKEAPKLDLFGSLFGDLNTDDAEVPNLPTVDEPTGDRNSGGGQTRGSIIPPKSIKTLDLIPEKLESISKKTREIKVSWTEGFIAPSELARQKMEEFRQTLNGIVESGIENTIMGLAGAIGELAAGTGSLSNFAGIALMGIANIMEQFGKLAIQAGITSEAIKNAIKLTGFGAIAAGIALVGLSKFVKSKAKSLVPMADGGILSGPTAILAGEYPGARNNPEVIAPLDKLKNLIQPASPSAVMIGGELRVRGNDLVYVLERTQNNRDRFR